MRTLRRPRPRTAGGEDRLSALPDDLILLIVSMLDTRTALSTAALARSWARIPRQLQALDFRVSDILPPEYDRTVSLRQRNLPHETTLAKTLDDLMAGYEIDTMSSFAKGVTSFLEADGGQGRRVKTLRLEFFQTYESICADRLITAAVGEWGVEDLEVVVRPASGDDQTPAYSLPQDCLNLRSGLRNLTLGKYCTLPQLHSYGTLTKLVLRDIPATTPVDVYERVFKDCTGLRVLHLTSCYCAHDTLVVDAPPCSQMRELVVEECSFLAIELRALPMLVRLACCLIDTERIVFGWVPCLRDTNLTFSIDGDELVATRRVHELDGFLLMSPTMRHLVIRLTGLRRFIAPSDSQRQLPELKCLLVADLPTNWDILWPGSLLMAAPSLELLHIHVPDTKTEPDQYMWRSSIILSESHNNLRHHHLKELVLLGFTQRHIRLLKHVVSVCTSLERIALLKYGHVQYNELWYWEMVGIETCPWRDDEEMLVRRVIKNFGLRPLVELILG